MLQVYEVVICTMDYSVFITDMSQTESQIKSCLVLSLDKTFQTCVVYGVQAENVY